MSEQNTVRGKKNGKPRKANALMRKKLAGLFVGVVVALICLLIRISLISATRGEQYSKQVLASSQSQYSSTSLAYKRGDIVDRHGTVLATSEKMYNVVLDCSVVNYSPNYLEPTLKALTNVFGLDEEEMRKLLSDEATSSSQYQVVKRKVSIEEKQAYDSYVNGTEERPLTQEEKDDRYYVRGIWFEEQYVRTYPLGSLAGEVLGFTYDTDQADYGIEGYYNNTLCGIDGRKYGYWGTDSQIEQTIVEPINGLSIRSTIDVNIQSIVENTITEFEDVYKEGVYSSNQAAKNIGVIVMDPNDGSVLAMASSEGYDPNSPRDLDGYYSEEQIEAMSAEQKAGNLEQIWRNFCISDSFEPGSVFKPVTVSSALECNMISESDTFICDGYETVSGVKIKCSKTDGHGEEALSDVISNSCNDGLMQIASSLGLDNYCKYQKLFNFGQRTGIDLSGENSGIIGSADTMGSVDLATASFGQGFTCTMIQEAAAIASIINGGTYYRPHVVSSILDSNGTVLKSFDSIVMKQTVSSDVAEAVKTYMKASVDSGTSKYAKVDGYSMGGKTGTAQKIPRGNGQYLVSFIGYAPYENPQVLIYVVVDEPNVAEQADSRYPQWIARDILEEILPYMNVYQDEELNPTLKYLSMDFDNPTGNSDTDTVADTNVPEPGSGNASDNGDAGNRLETDGFTNEEAGLDYGE